MLLSRQRDAQTRFSFVAAGEFPTDDLGSTLGSNICLCFAKDCE
jgi:hypothetical protein